MIIGFVGFKQVGKSTAAQYLKENYNFVRINFKDQLVAEIKQNFPDLLREIAYTTDFDQGIERAIDDLFNTKPPLMRALLQNYGTEVRRNDNPHYWTDQWEETIIGETGDIVVDDVRFVNEAESVRNCGGVIIRLMRPDIATGGDHQSETEQLSIVPDYTILCQPGEPTLLYDALDDILKELR